MAVYVDEVFQTLPIQRKKWKHPTYTHMTADTKEELHAMALKIGLKRCWYQDHGHPHYDLNENKRTQALNAGAIFKPAKEQALERLRAKGMKI